MSDRSVGRNESPEKIKFLFLSNNRCFSVHSRCTTEYWIKILHVNTFTLKQITNLCSFRPTLKTGKLGVDLTIMDKKNKITFLGNSVHVDAK